METSRQQDYRTPGAYCAPLSAYFPKILSSASARRSLTMANIRLPQGPQGPQRQLLTKHLKMVAIWSPLEDRVLLWTGMLSKSQQSELDLYIRRLPVARSRSLLTGTCRSLSRLTRTLWVTFRSLVAEAATDDTPCDGSSPPLYLITWTTRISLTMPSWTHPTVWRLRLLLCEEVVTP